MSVRASIAMAVYNGEKFLKLQIESIVKQLGSEDELIISVDPGKDGSKAVALEFLADSRVKVIDGPGKGVIRNFENALKHVNGEYVFLSDQDDVWREDKIDKVLQALCRDGVYAVVHDALVTDEQLKVLSDTFFKIDFYPGIIKNIIKNRYIGCCMAFKGAVLDYALPFPKRLPMHDQWLGITAKKLGDVEFISEPLIYYRRHAGVVTGKSRASAFTKLKWRSGIMISTIFSGWRKKR